MEFYDNAFWVLDYVDSSTATIHKLDTSGNPIDSSQIGIGSYWLGMTQKNGHFYIAYDSSGRIAIKNLDPTTFDVLKQGSIDYPVTDTALTGITNDGTYFYVVLLSGHLLKLSISE